MRWTLRRPAGSFRPGETLAAYGEIVWSWRRDPGVHPVPPECGFGNGGKKGRSPGRSRISRKPVARGKPGCLGCTCRTRVRSTLPIAHGAAGAVGARLSLRPFIEKGANEMKNPGENLSRDPFRLTGTKEELMVMPLQESDSFPNGQILPLLRMPELRRRV